MPTRKKPLKERFTTARNDRKTVYHYFPIDETKSEAIMGGRCSVCGKITAHHCSRCNIFFCEKHVEEHVCEKKIDYVG